MILGFLMSTLISVSPEHTVQNRDFLVNQLRNEMSDLRISAAEKLGELKYPEALAALSELAKDPVPAVRFAGIRALSRYLNQEALDALNSAYGAESDPYLKAEVRRSKKSIEDFMKAEAEKAEKEKLAPPSKKKK